MYQTITFKQIFESVEDWEQWCDNLHIYDSTDATAKALRTEIYYLLYNRYLGVGVAYDYPDLFCAELGIAMKEYFTQFLKHTKIVGDIYNLTSADYTELGTAIMNYANNPNYNTSSNTDDWAFIKYISNQTRTKNNANKLSAYINALRSMPDLQINAFLKKVDYMWLNIIPRQKVIFYEEED